MTLARIPVEDHLDLLLSFAQVSPAIAPYEEIARSKGLRIVEEKHDSEYRAFKCKGFALMLMDEEGKNVRYGKLARLHCAGLFWEEEDKVDEDLGIITVSSMQDLRQAYERLYQKLKEKLGMPTQEEVWTSEWMMGFEDPSEEEFAYTCWRLSNSLLVLLLNEEGDLHGGEEATVDIRIAPLDRQKGLPNNISDPWAWPVEY